jgi:hypothetical protein
VTNLDARLRRIERTRGQQPAPGVVIIYDAAHPPADASPRAPRGALAVIYLPDNHREPAPPMPTR